MEFDHNVPTTNLQLRSSPLSDTIWIQYVKGVEVIEEILTFEFDSFFGSMFIKAKS